jgi:hypothetical protein
MKTQICESVFKIVILRKVTANFHSAKSVCQLSFCANFHSAKIVCQLSFCAYFHSKNKSKLSIATILSGGCGGFPPTTITNTSLI